MNWSEWADRWPHAAHSRFVDARPHRWHVQRMGQGPVLLLLHGAGAATHSWRGLMPLLAETHDCIAVDLPGHGFTTSVPGRAGLDAMAEDLGTLLDVLEVEPSALVGHSAGATVALRLSLDRGPRPVAAINGAWALFDGFAAWLFPFMAKALAVNPLTVPLFTAMSSPRRTRQLLERTGSRIDEEGLRLYHALLSDRAHVSGALAKMASWDLRRLHRDAARHGAPVLLLAGDRDGTVPPKVSREMLARLPDASLQVLGGLGHLAHEEAPETVLEAMRPVIL
ncbi:alpha/beta fold hydrolase [Jannaschia sp. Os4]|uniref:alpha/beta fold hydrolase BchO n=1 Tax=Jannaschia sp. Os4 TaxID=2807617 RepID=UPI0019396409|nr:alpha/beta fold hydrolase [Jannaschia sp. Os4]